MQRVAAAAGTNDGKNIHCVGVDELHELVGKKLEQVWNILTNGLGAREQPMIWQITTAGIDEDTVCRRQYTLLQDIRDGVIEDDTFWGVWFECPKHYPDGRVDDAGNPVEVPYDSQDAVELCNPSFGSILSWPFYKDQLTKKTEATYRRYFLNQWTESDEIWEGADYWDDNAGDPVLDETTPLYMAVDMSIKHDASALVRAQWSPSRAHCQVTQTIWENPYSRRHPKHKEWRMSVSEIEDEIRDYARRFPESAAMDDEDYPIPGPAVFYDPMFFERSAQVLRDEGINMVEFPQTELRMTEASQRLFELVKQALIEHDGNPVAKQHVRASAVKETNRGWRITRSSGTRRANDFTIACAMATLEATRGVELDEWDQAPTLTIPPEGGNAGKIPSGRPKQKGPLPGQETFRFYYTDGSDETVYAPDQRLAMEALLGVRQGKHIRRGEMLTPALR